MISRGASYAVRALTHMASASPDDWLLNREIAQELSLPPQFLTKILRTLAEAGILVSQRGKTGGFRLTRATSEIRLLDIVDPFDSLAGRRACLLGQAVCSDETACPLHEEGRVISEKLVRILSTRTLADLVRRSGDEGFPRGLESQAGRPVAGSRKKPAKAAAAPSQTRRNR